MSIIMLKSRLVEEVKKRRWMFDKKQEEYANRKDWFKMVAEILNAELAKFGIACTGTQLMNMWDDLYAKFRKNHLLVINAPSGSSADILKITNEPEYQALLFVKDSVIPRPPLSSLDNLATATSSQAPSNVFTSNVQSNFNMWQVQSNKRKNSAQRNSHEQGKFKSKKFGNHEIGDTKGLMMSMQKLIEKTSSNLNKTVTQDTYRDDLNDKQASVKNMLTKKFLKLSPANIEPAFKEMRSGILTILGDSQNQK